MHRDVESGASVQLLRPSFDCLRSMTPDQGEEAELIGKYGREDGDTGSAEVQVALLTERINELTEHLRDAQQGPPLAPRPADDGRQAPPPAPLPRARRPRALPRPGRRARPASLASDRAPATPAPDFTLRNQDGEKVSLADFRGRKVMLVFYPLDFSPVCTDQLSIYQEVLPRDRGAGRRRWSGSASTASWAHKAFQREARHRRSRCSPTSSPRARCSRPTAPTSRSVGHGNRSLVLVDEDGMVELGARVAHPARDPRRQPDLRRPCCRRLSSATGSARASGRSLSGVTDLTSAARPADRARRSRPRRGAGGDRLPRPRLPALRGDLGDGRASCPCGSSSATSRSPASTRGPRRSTPQPRPPRRSARRLLRDGRLDLCATRGRIDDPHLWERARTLGLDLERFERDRRSATVAERVRRDFEAGIRAGVTGTPAAFVDGRAVGRDVAAALAALA